MNFVQIYNNKKRLYTTHNNFTSLQKRVDFRSFILGNDKISITSSSDFDL